MAYYEFQPFGEYREDVRHGIRAALSANTSRNSKVHPKPFTVADFLPFKPKEEEVNPVKVFKDSMKHLVVRKDG